MLCKSLHKLGSGVEVGIGMITGKRYCDRRYIEHRRLRRCAHGAGVDDINGGIASVIDATHHKVRHRKPALAKERAERKLYAIGRCAADRESKKVSILVKFCHPKWQADGECMSHGR